MQLLSINSRQNTWNSLNYDITLNVIQVICKLLLWYLDLTQHVTLLLNWKFMQHPKRGNTGSFLWAAVTMVPEILPSITFLMPFFPHQKELLSKFLQLSCCIDTQIHFLSVWNTPLDFSLVKKKKLLLKIEMNALQKITKVCVFWAAISLYNPASLKV